MHVGCGDSVTLGGDLVDQNALLRIAQHDAVENVDHGGILRNCSATRRAVSAIEASSEPNTFTSTGSGVPERSPIRSWITCANSTRTPGTVWRIFPRTSFMIVSISRLRLGLCRT